MTGQSCSSQTSLWLRGDGCPGGWLSAEGGMWAMQARGGLKQFNPKEADKVSQGNCIRFCKVFLIPFSNRNHKEWLK